MKLVPLGDKVVLKQLEAEETTKSGLILTSSCTGNHKKLWLWQLVLVVWLVM